MRGGAFAVVEEPVSHEVLVVLGVAAVKRGIVQVVQVVTQFALQPTTGLTPLLFLLGFVLL